MHQVTHGVPTFPPRPARVDRSCRIWCASGRAGPGQQGRDIRSRHRWTLGPGSNLHPSHAAPSRQSASGHVDRLHHPVRQGGQGERSTSGRSVFIGSSPQRLYRRCRSRRSARACAGLSVSCPGARACEPGSAPWRWPPPPRCPTHPRARPRERRRPGPGAPPAPPHQAARAGGPQELHVQVRRGGKITRLQLAGQGWSHRLVGHGRQEAALHHPGRIQERATGSEGDLDRPLLRADR